MNTLRDYLSAYRGIEVSPAEADALEAFWTSLRSRRPDSGDGQAVTDDIPVVFNPTAIGSPERLADE